MARTELEQLVYQMDVNVTKMNKKLAKMDGDTVRQVKKTQSDFDKLGSGIGNSLGGAIDGVAGQIPVLSDGLSALGGVAGGAALVGLAALAFGLNQAKEAMLWSAEVTDLSEKLGITAEALQKLEFAADESGVPLEKLHDALGNLNASLGAIKSGVGDAKIKKVFEALGLTKADVAGVQTSAEFIPILADRISKLGSVAEQVKLAKTLGVEALVPLLARGSEGVRELTQRAVDLGIVLDNQTVKALDDMNRKVEIANDQIDKNLKRAFLGLAPAITSSTQALADFTNWAAKAAAAYSKWNNTAEREAAYRMVPVETVRASRALKGTRARQASKQAYNEQQGRLAAAAVPIVEVPTGGSSRASPSANSGGIDPFTGKALDQRAIPSWWIEPKKLEELSVALTHAAAAQDVWNAAFEMTPGIIDPAIQKMDALSESASYFAGDLIYGLTEAAARGADIGDVLVDSIQRAAVAWAASKLFDLAGIEEGGGVRKGSPLANILSKIPGFANGTRSAPGGLALVGERGAELVNLNRGARVYTASETQSILNGANQARGGSLTYAPVIDLKGAVMTEDLVAGLRREMVAGQRKTLAMVDSQNRRTFAGRSASLSKLGTV